MIEMRYYGHCCIDLYSHNRLIAAYGTISNQHAQLSGMGLALVGTTIEQDAAYWECHIEIPSKDTAYELMFGVATKKDRKFYDALEEQEEGEASI
jgi:hypothetical protein